MLAALLLNLSGGGPAPGPAPGPAVFGAPIYWREAWTDEDERRLRKLKREQVQLQHEKDIELPPLVLRPDVGGAQQARLGAILARIERIHDEIVRLEIKKADDDEMDTFMMFINAIGD